MKKVIIAICILLLGCSKEGNQPDKKDDFISKMNGEAYLGMAKSRLYLNGHDPLPSLEGTASLSADQINGDSLMLSVVVELPQNDGFTIGIPGKQDGTSWSAIFPKGIFTIGDNGSMGGRVSDGKKEISWDGNLGNDYARFDVRIKYLIKEGNIPESSILVTQLDLSRFSERTSNNPGSCENIVWQTRAVFNIYSGGVDLIRVPVCN